MSKRTDKTKKTTGKSALTVLKNWIAEEDMRNCLALVTTVGSLVIMALSVVYGCASCVVPPMSGVLLFVLGWYKLTEKNDQ